MADSRLHDQPETTGATAQGATSTTPPDAPQQMVYRRAPKISPFLVTGAVLGILIAFFWVGIQGPTPEYAQAQTLGFLAAVLGILGLLLGALWWMLLDRRSKRHTEMMYARRTENPESAHVALTEDDYREWSRLQQQAEADKKHQQQRAEIKNAAKAKKRNKRK